MFDEGCLHGMKLIAICEAFHGDDVCAMRARGGDEAGHNGFAIKEYGTCAAFAFGTAFFCAGQHAFFTQQT